MKLRKHNKCDESEKRKKKENKNCRTARKTKSNCKVKVVTRYNVLSTKYVNEKIVKQKNKRKCYTSEAINEVVKAINEGASFRKAGEMYGVPYATLFRKLKNPQVINKTSGPPTVLTADEEKDIVTWLIYRAETGMPVTKIELFDCIKTYLSKEQKETCFKDNRPGKKCYFNFRKRHPDISLRVAQNLPLVRAAVTEEDLRQWFKEVQKYIEKKDSKDIHASRVFNCDETNIQLHPKPEKVLTQKGARTVYKVVDAPERENATALFMYNALGTRAPPMILYTYKELPKKVIQSCPEGWGVGLSDSGGMNTETFYEYMTRVFYPWLVKSEIEFPVIVYMDGHTSHVTLPLVKFCIEKRIELITWFAHSTHIIQPLDIAFFHPLKDVYKKKAVPTWKRENNDRRLKKEDFPKVLEMALGLFSEEKEVIINGFKAAGLYPFNPDNVEYNVLRKKKLSKKKKPVEPETTEETQSLENAEQHLKSFENNLPLSLLNLFKSCGESQKWHGSIQNEGLFNYWLMLKKNISGTLSIEDREDVVVNSEIVRQISIPNELDQLTPREPIPIEKLVNVPTKLFEASQEEPFLAEQLSNLAVPSQLDQAILQEPITVDEVIDDTTISFLKNFDTSDEVFTIVPPEYFTVDDVEFRELSVRTNLNSQTKKEDLNDPIDVIDNAVHKRSIDTNHEHDSTSHDKLIPLTDKFNRIVDENKKESSQDTDTDKQKENFVQSFTIPTEYLPKNKRIKLQTKDKKKLPAVGTSKEWLEIQVEKERRQKIREETLLKKKQEQKKKVVEEKKKLEAEMKLLNKKIKEVVV